jgi:hypothetical protein
MVLAYAAHQLSAKVALYDGSYETMRGVRKYASLLLNSRTSGKTNVSILAREYPDLLFKVMEILEKHGQVIVKKDDGIWFETSTGKVFQPIHESDVPAQSLTTMIRHQVEFPKLDQYR